LRSNEDFNNNANNQLTCSKESTTARRFRSGITSSTSTVTGNELALKKRCHSASDRL
ncbi:unnamed protein product, partial [Adineta steineri]